MSNIAKGNPSNYKKVQKWLEDNEIEYYKMTEYQYRIMGPIALIDLWPSRMTVHVIQTESIDPNRYFRMSWNFNPEELGAVLYGNFKNN